VDVLEVNQADIGTALPSQVVSYLQSNPDVKYIGLTGTHYMPGVEEALQGAGIDLPKIISYTSLESDAQALKDGTYYGLVYSDVLAEQWLVIDFFARYFADEQPDPQIQDPLMVVNSDNVDGFPTTPFPGWTDAYTAGWGVS
jgi:ribose transport system substrate-binding protein